MPDKIQLIKGASFTDQRGTLRFVNDFTFSQVRRFYQIAHVEIGLPRAWQGHQVEHKYFYEATGRFLIALIAIDNWQQPSENLVADKYILTVSEPAILSVPPGYANGIKALEADSLLTVYSNLSLSDSEKDRWSFDSSLWLDWTKI